MEINNKNKGWGCLATIVFCLIIYFSLKSCLSLSPQEKKEAKLEEDTTDFNTNAKITAEAAIKDELKCPSTAKFQEERINSKGWNKGDTVYALEIFDAQNGFGAMMRDEWLVEEKITGDYHDYNNFEVIKVTTSDEVEKSLEKAMDKPHHKHHRH